MTTKNKTLYEQTILAADRMKYPSLPEHARYVPPYTEKTANGLTKMIVAFMRALGSSTFTRTNTTGIYRAGATYQDQNGRTIREKGMYVPNTGVKGRGDCEGMYKGKFISVEVKIGKDRLSPQQINYGMSVEKDGGVYIVAKNFDMFVEQLVTLNIITL